MSVMPNLCSSAHYFFENVMNRMLCSWQGVPQLKKGWPALQYVVVTLIAI
jgi:hypothetical protein